MISHLMRLDGSGVRFPGVTVPGTQTEEYKQLADEKEIHRHAASRLGMFLGDIIQTRNWWRRLATETDLYGHPPNVRELYGKAASALNTTIGEAMNRRREHCEVIERLQSRQLEICNEHRTTEGYGLADAMEEVHKEWQMEYEAERCCKFIDSYLQWLDTADCKGG